MIFSKEKILYISLAVILSFSLISSALAFQGPTAGQNPGAGGGAFSLDPTGNIGFGTYKISGSLGTNYNTPPYGSFSNVFMIAATSSPPGIALRNVGSGGSGTYGYGLMDATWVWQLTPWGAITLSNAGSSFSYNRNAMTVFPDNRVVFPGPFGSGTNWFYPTSTLNVIGDATVSNNVIALAFSGNASNVSGVIASNVGGGAFQSANYAFPLSLQLGSSNTSNLPQTLSVEGGGYFSGSVGIGTTGPTASLEISRTTDAANHLILTQTESATDQSFALSVTDDRKFRLRDITNTQIPFMIEQGAGDNALYIKNGGNVGIGTTGPNALLSLGTSVQDNKLYVYDGSSDKYGFGIRSSQFMIYSGAAGASTGGITFGKFDGATFTEAMRIRNDGNVGIGLTTIDGTLDIYKAGQSATRLVLKSDQRNDYLTTGGALGVIEFKTDGPGLGVTTVDAIQSIARNGNYDLGFFTYVGPLTEKVTIKGGTGNVGIGTTVPTGKLDIQGSSATNAYTAPADQADLRVLSSLNRSYDGGIIEIGGSSGATGYIKTQALNNNAGAMTFGTRRNSDDATMQPTMTLDSAGYVGIGTVTPTTRLDVNGTITATSFSGALTGALNAGYISSGTFGSLSTPGNYTFDTNTLAIDATNHLVGIGTTSPGDKLSVAGNIGSGGSTFTSPGGTSGQGIALPSTANDAVRIFGEHNGGDTSNGIFYTGDNTNDGWYFRQVDCCGAGTLDYMRIARDGVYYAGEGNFGIGTTSPGVKLQVNDTSRAATAMYDLANIRVWVSDADAIDKGGSINFGNTASAIAFAGIAGRKENATAGNYSGYLQFVTSLNSGASDERMRITSAGYVGIGTTDPGAKLDVNGGDLKITDATGGGGFIYGLDTNHGIYFREGSVNKLNYYEYGGTLASGSGHRFYTGGVKAAQTLKMQIADDGTYIAGNVGIGTTVPAAPLDVTGSIYTTGSVVARGGTGTGMLWPTATSLNFQTQTGGTITLSPSFNANPAVATMTIAPAASNIPGNVGIGTTVPGTKLAALGGSNMQAGFDFAQQGDVPLMYLARSTDGSLTSYQSQGLRSLYDASTGGYGLAFQAGGTAATLTGSLGAMATKMFLGLNGNFGIGTTAPAYVLDVNGDATFNGNTIHGVHSPSATTDAANKSYVDSAITSAVGGTSTSTGAYVLKSGDAMSGNLNMGGNNITGVNKLYVTTIDPVYKIGGVKYATYVSNTIGQKEEVYGKMILTNDKGLMTNDKYQDVIDFNNVERGSDLWLFWQTIAEGKNMKDIQVLLTPQFDGRAWYELNPEEKQIIIYGVPVSSVISHQSLAVSYHLVAPRHDANEWLNQIETSEKGIPLNVK